MGNGAMGIESMWSQAQKDYCCATMGRGCVTTSVPTTALPAPIVTQPPTPFPTPPPTPPPTRPPPPPTRPPTRPPPPPVVQPAPVFVPPPVPAGPVDPYNCAVGQYFAW